MPSQRAAVFVDGFNLYHAIEALREDHLKWLSLRKLSEEFVPAPQFAVTEIFYFTALAKWRPPQSWERHSQYIKALEAEGITVVSGKFKKRRRRCHICQEISPSHEEKETDVNIALYLLDGAYQDLYDRALILTADSDLAPAIRMVRKRFPQKSIKLLQPVGRKSSELVGAVGGAGEASEIKRIHLERCRLPESITDKNGNIIRRPAKYDPPS